MPGGPRIYPYQQPEEALATKSLLLEITLLPAAFILARAGILGELFPFGPAFLVLVARRFPRQLVFVATSLSLGSLSCLDGLEAYSRVALYTIFASLFIFYPALRTKRDIFLAVLLLSGEIVVRGSLLTFTGPELYSWVGVVFEGLLAGGLAMVFQESLGLFLLFFGFLLGLGSWEVAGLSLQGIAGRAAVLAAALAGGAGAGAAAGAAIGFLSSLASFSVPTLAGLLAFSGLAAGAFCSLGKAGAIGGFFLAHLLLASYFLGQAGVVTAFKESLLAAFLVVLIPEGILEKLEKLVAFAGGQEEKQAVLADRLKVQARVWQKLAEELRPLKEQSDDYWTQTWEEIGRPVCRGCPADKLCWQVEKKEMMELLQDLQNKLEKRGNLTLSDLPDRLVDRCSRGGELLAALIGHRGAGAGQQHRYNGPATLLATQYRALASMLAELAAGEEQEESLEERVFLSIESGFASLPRYQEDVCGDTFASFSLPGGRYFVILSDGMGTGDRAAAASRKAVKLLQAMLKAGFPRELALHILNTVLFYSSPVESFVTLDLACLDLKAGRVEFSKMGACPSFLRRGSEVWPLRSQSLPAGIWEEASPVGVTAELLPGDVLVMLTDGVLESHREVGEREKWIMDSLRRALIDNAQLMAERLLKQARALVGERPRDDMAVAVVIFHEAKIEKKEEKKYF
ncbi:MAG: stage sporulation protein [Clostridia bacterium]|nr:stage sporulation protein [Clostridia bacterium]